MGIPLVSVIIPNYNHDNFLEKRIDSVINQSFQDFEIIILDDCSTDQSINIIEKYRHHEKVYKIVYNEFNSGSTFKQWILGINICRTKYIWIAESDDYAEPDFLIFSVEKLNSLEDFNCSFVQSRWINHASEIFAHPEHENFTPEELLNENFIKNKMLAGCYLYNASAVLFKKTAYLNYKNEIDFYLNRLKHCGDWLFWAYILKNSKVGLIYSYQNYFRRLENAVSEKRKLEFIVVSEIVEIIKQIKYMYKINLTIADASLITNSLINFWNDYEDKNPLVFLKLLKKSASIHKLIPTILILKKIKRIGN